MPLNNFLLFDQNKGNMMEDEAYSVNMQRLNGVQSGVASSMLNNKFAYQVSLVAYAIAQMMNANGIDATDTMAVSQFVNNLSSTVLQKIADKASVEEAKAGTSDTKWMSPMKVQQEIESYKDFVCEVKEIDFTHAESIDKVNVNFDILPDFIIWAPLSSYNLRGSGGNLLIKGDQYYFNVFSSWSGSYAIVNGIYIVNQTNLRFDFRVNGISGSTEIESRAYCFYKRNVPTSASS